MGLASRGCFALNFDQISLNSCATESVTVSATLYLLPRFADSLSVLLQRCIHECVEYVFMDVVLYRLFARYCVVKCEKNGIRIEEISGCLPREQGNL